MESYSQSLSVYRQEGETLVPLYVFIVEQARRKLDLMKGMKKTMKRKMSVACCVLLLIASAMNMLGVMALAAPSFQRPIDVDGGSWVDAYRYYMDNMSPYKGYAVLADFDLDGKPELLALEGEWSHAGAAGCFVKYTGSQYIVYKDSSLFVWDDQLHLVLDNGSYVWYKSSSYASTGYYGSYVSRLSFSGNMKLSESKWFEMHGDMDEGTEAYQIGSRGVSWNEYNQEEAKWNRMNKLLTLDPASFASQAKIVHIDIDRSEINKNVQTDHHIVGDAKQVLMMLNERLTQQDHSEWKKFVFQYPTETEYEDGGDTLNPKQLCNTIAKLMPNETILATDVGQHQMWSIQHFHFEYPGQLLTSGGFGTMGFGLGAAIGAQVGNPDKMVIHVTGDGSFRMNCNELATVEHYGLPIITFVFNNQTLGMVRQWQNLIYKGNISETTMDRGPDFVKLAEAYGLKGRRVSNQKDLAEAIEDAMASKCGYVIDCMLDIDEMVRPMVGGGSRITDFMRT